MKTLSSTEWLAKATHFDMGECPIYKRPVEIVARGNNKWAVKMHEWVLGKDGKFIYEPMPSSRTDKFISNTRFNSPDEAYTFWQANVKEPHALYL